MHNISSYLNKASYEIGRLVHQIDANSWIAIGFVAFVVGAIMLRGNVIRRF